MLVQPPIGFVFVEFCKFWKTWFWHDLPPPLLEIRRVDDACVTLLIASLCINWCFWDDNNCDVDLLWYNSGMGGVVLMYQPHWGDISDPFEPSILVSTDVCLPYGLVGIINPFPTVRGFIFGMYLDTLPAVFLSWSDSLWASSRIDLDFRMADLVGLWKLPFTDEYGLILCSWCDILCSFPIILIDFQKFDDQKANIKVR